MGFTPPHIPLAPPILQAIERGATILTPNQRAARTLRRAYDSIMHARHLSLWAPPQIFALDTWLPTLWHSVLLDGADNRVLLNRSQEHVLWRAVIAADREVSGLRSAGTLADLAADAWRSLHLYNGHDRLQAVAISTDTRAFYRWSLLFHRLCTHDHYLTPGQLAPALEGALTRGQLSLPDFGIALIDFEATPPALASLLESIERAGYPVVHIGTTIPAPTASLITAPHDRAELRVAARWARDTLARTPKARIAIVAPALAIRRPHIERTFREILRNPTAFEFSLGSPLAQTAPIAAALDLLRWTLAPLPTERISALLLSPFFAPLNEPTAEFDAFDLRQANTLRPQFSIDDVIELITRSNLKARLPRLHQALRELRRAATETSATQPQTHAALADSFRNILEACGWAHATERDSFSYQAAQRWQSALDELATLDFNSARLTASVALETLTRIATQTIFAPESQDSPVQILGPLELGGVPFDALWFLGADDSAWPAIPSLNPLLPWQLQRALSMPGADSNRDTALAQALTNRIAASASEVNFSYAARSTEGPRRLSPLVRALDLTILDELEAEPPRTPLTFETFLDTTPLAPIPQTTLRGGANVLALQAACPFRAFAERRLQSAEPGTRDLGFDPADRGSLVHRVMQGFWNQLHTQQALRKLAPAERESLLTEYIDLALDRTHRQVQTPWDAAYLEVQRDRLHHLLLPWLDFELDRPAFTVLATEQETKAVEIGPLTLDLRVDRVDETVAGRLILDYKTGAATPSEWLTDRPDAPQLPLYAVLADPESLGGIAFASLRAGDDLCLKGYADTPAVFGKPSPMKLPTLQAQLEDWHRVLENLAIAFSSGDAQVTPKCYPKTCQYCAQRILCRLDPTTLSDYGDDEAEFPGIGSSEPSYA